MGKIEKIKTGCNCILETQDLIKKEVIAQNSKTENGYKYLAGAYENLSLFPITRFYTNFIIRSTFKKKDGTTSRPKNSHVSIFYKYCPFCGNEYPK
jgi:hypothetical protein